MREAPPLERDGEQPAREQVQDDEHHRVGGDERDAGAGDPQRLDERDEHDDVDDDAGERRREVARRDAGAPADRHEHEEQPVHRPAERDPRQRLVRLEVLRRGEQAHDPAAEQRQPGDDEPVTTTYHVVTAA